MRVVLITALVLRLSTPALAKTLLVGPDQPYTQIQQGINAARNGDTIVVAPGEYAEWLTFPRLVYSVTLKAAPGSRIAHFHGIDTHNAPDLLLQGFDIANPSATRFGGHAILLRSPQVTIAHNFVSAGYGWGVYTPRPVTDILIRDNMFDASPPYGGVYTQGTSWLLEYNAVEHDANKSGSVQAYRLSGTHLTARNNFARGPQRPRSVCLRVVGDSAEVELTDNFCNGFGTGIMVGRNSGVYVTANYLYQATTGVTFLKGGTHTSLYNNHIDWAMCGVRASGPIAAGHVGSVSSNTVTVPPGGSPYCGQVLTLEVLQNTIEARPDLMDTLTVAPGDFVRPWPWCDPVDPGHPEGCGPSTEGSPQV